MVSEDPALWALMADDDAMTRCLVGYLTLRWRARFAVVCPRTCGLVRRSMPPQWCAWAAALNGRQRRWLVRNLGETLPICRDFVPAGLCEPVAYFRRLGARLGAPAAAARPGDVAGSRPAVWLQPPRASADALWRDVAAMADNNRHIKVGT